MFKQRDIDYINQERFEKLSSEMKVSQTCASAGFMRKSLYSTIHPNHSRCGRWIWREDRSCGEFSLLRDLQDSENIGCISGHTKIGPVLQVKITSCLDQYGIEIQVQSTSRDGSNSWIVTSRGPKRVHESWHDQDDSPENGEMVSSTSVERSHAIKSSIEETHASKPQAQLLVEPL